MTWDEWVAAAPGYVAAGAGWLDEREPGWEPKVDLADLDVSNRCRCVLGQVFIDRAPDGYTAAMNEWWGDVSVADIPLGWPSHHGFSSPWGSTVEFALLDDLWTALIKGRHDLGTLSGR